MPNAINRHSGKNGEEDRKKRSKVLFTFTLLLTVIVITMVYFLIPDILGEKETSSQIRQMTQLTAEVGKLETILKKKELEFSNLIKKYLEQPDEDLPELNASGLTEGQTKIIEEKIKNRKDPFIKELLRNMLNKNDEISEIKQTIKEYAALLPRPHIVILGDIHYKIAADFLINEKQVEKDIAIRLIERTALFDELMPGFKVWNFYSGDAYGTFVTQGDASISPNELIRNAKKDLINARDKAISEKKSLAAEIEKLEKTRDSIKSEVENLRIEKNNLKTQNDNLSKENEEMKEKIEEINAYIKEMKNSLSYMIDVEKNLKMKGILKSKFLGSPKLEKIPFEYFTHTIDLSKNSKIEISAQQLKLSKIDGIALYPKFYERDIDYSVEIDEKKLKATLTFLAVDKFKTGRVIISVK